MIVTKMLFQHQLWTVFGKNKTSFAERCFQNFALKSSPTVIYHFLYIRIAIRMSDMQWTYVSSQYVSLFHCTTCTY